ncbi:MAG TPA: ferric reductase-like transmembrane domain-containing protein [Anaerolineaceae bacterium]
MQRKRVLQAIFWIALYLILTFAPLIVLFTSERPPGREFWREFSVALGFCGLAMMALQFVLTARFQTLKAPYGSDVVYFFHRQISLVTFTLILAHPILLFIFAPSDYLPLLNLVSAPWAARLGVTALLAAAGLIVFSIYRKRLRLDYTLWRITHGILAILAVGLATGHIILRAHYLNTPLKQALWIGYGLFWIGLLIYVRLLRPWMLLRHPYLVAQVIPERGNAVTLRLRPTHPPALRFQPGQFAWITAWRSPFSDTEHPFSISSSAENRDFLDFTIKELGDFTRTVRSLQVGQKVYVDGPYGAFSTDRQPHAQQFIFIAGGIGITPMMSMLRTFVDRREPRPLTLIYANRNWEGVTFREELEQIRSRLNLNLIHVLEQPPEDWNGERGFISENLLRRCLPEGAAENMVEIFICGPKPMMDAVEKALVRLGIPYGDFHSERFDFV